MFSAARTCTRDIDRGVCKDASYQIINLLGNSTHVRLRYKVMIRYLDVTLSLFYCSFYYTTCTIKGLKGFVTWT